MPKATYAHQPSACSDSKRASAWSFANAVGSAAPVMIAQVPRISPAGRVNRSIVRARPGTGLVSDRARMYIAADHSCRNVVMP